MKKVLLFIFVVLLFFSIFDCSYNGDENETKKEKKSSHKKTEYNLLDKDDLIKACNDTSYMEDIMKNYVNKNDNKLTKGSSTYIWGDANQDGYVNIVDALVVAQYSVGISNPTITEYIKNGKGDKYCNINLKSPVDIVDALIIAQYSVGNISSLPIRPILNFEYVPGEVLLTFYDEIDINQFIQSYNNVQLDVTHSSAYLYLLKVPAGEEAEYIYQFSLNDLVKYAEANGIISGDI